MQVITRFVVEAAQEGVLVIPSNEEIAIAAAMAVATDDDLPEPTQAALDAVDEASMESFPCSDPPGYTMSHS